MPWQLIYTSAPRGLLSGQSGFCTVARSGDLREALAQRLEQISSYHYLRVAEAATASRNPTVCACRILDLRGTRYHVLTRIQPCGLDFTARTNHLAHHLVFQGSELSQLPSPAAILRHWNGWLASWQGEPRLLEDPPLGGFDMAAKSSLPAQTWLQATGDAGRAAGLLESECARGCYLTCPAGSEQQVLAMFCETLELLNLNGQFALRPWRHTFTTFLQAEDNPSDFQWRACQEGSPAHQQAAQRATGIIPLRSVRVPTNSLVKVAREGLKPPGAPAAEAAPHAKLTLQRSAGRRPRSSSMPEVSAWQRSSDSGEKPSFLNLNLSIKPATLAGIGVFAAVLLSLLAMRFWLSKKHGPFVPNPPTQAQSATPGQAARLQARPEKSAPLDLAQLDRLSGDGPTYIFATTNLITFSLPIDTVSRFQNLIQRFDHLETRPSDIQLSLNTDGWDFPSGAPLNVSARQTQMLSAQTAAGLECSFDYSNWKSDPHNPVVVRTTFSTPPSAVSVHFGFSDPGNGEPFRLLIVNEGNPPAPLHLSLQWLKCDGDSLAASLQPPLGAKLFGAFMLPGLRQWQLQPFITNKDAPQARYLYKDWPAEDQPPPGLELDFAEVKRRLATRQGALKARVAELTGRMEKQLKKANLDLPLGTDLAVTNKNLASFSRYADDPAPSDFVDYLNKLKKRTGINGWPLVAEDDGEADLAGKFQQIFDLVAENAPAERPYLMVGNNNYFSAVWQTLRSIDKNRRDKQRAKDDIDRIEGRLSVIPGTLDNVKHVGLFITDPPRPALEMIRFEGP